MDVREIEKERRISPLPARKKVKWRQVNYVLNKHVQHLSLLFYLNGGGKKISYLSTHASSADSTVAAALSTQDRLFVMLIHDKKVIP